MTREELEAMAPEEVKKIANDIGAKFHYKAGQAKVIDAVLGKLAGSGVDDEGDVPDAPAPAPAKPTATQTFAPPAAPVTVPVSTEPGKIQMAAIIAKEKSEWPTPEHVTEALRSHIARGLQIVTMTAEYWHVRLGTREAAGNMKIPLKQIVMQANVLLTPTRAPTEE